METSKLKSLTVKALSEMANKLKIKDHIGLKKPDLIKLILEAQSKKKENPAVPGSPGRTRNRQER